MRARAPVFAIVVLAIGLLGGEACFKDLPRDGEDGDVPIVEDPDGRCAALASAFPPALDFAPGGRLWVANLSPATLVPFDVDEVPPAVAESPGPFRLPPDSDSNGLIELNPKPVLEGLDITGPSDAFVTAFSYEEVLFFDPATGQLEQRPIAVPAGVPATDFPYLPAPGDPPRNQTGLSTYACLRPDPGSEDSRGDEYVISVADRCDAGRDNSFYSRGTSGAVAASGCLFASVANPGEGAGTADPQYLPGAVLVYAVFPECAPSDPTPPTIFTEGYNPIHVTPYPVGTRNFVLVAVSGALGTVLDDPLTPDVVEGGYRALTDAAIEVIDADSDPPRLAATIPLGPAGLAGNLAVDPTGRIAVIGSAVGRWLLAVDLTPLATLPNSGPSVVLDGSDPPHASAVIHDATDPFVIPARTDGADRDACPGHTAGVAFNDSGDKVFVSDFCDGTLSVVDVDVAASNPFTFARQIKLTAPIDTANAASPRGPGPLAVRPGDPSSYDGPDVFVLVGQPEGLVCAIDVESGS